MDREKLPFRKNCEGYFIDDKGKVLAKDSGKGFLIFPGGGIDENETPEEGMLREAFEETGVSISGKLKELGILNILWGPDWAKTEKQKKRYQKYKGDEMHFFLGKIKSIGQPSGDPENPGEDDSWGEDKLMPVQKAIDLIEKNKPFPKDTEEYYQKQLNFLSQIVKNLI